VAFEPDQPPASPWSRAGRLVRARPGPGRRRPRGRGRRAPKAVRQRASGPGTGPAPPAARPDHLPAGRRPPAGL